MNNAWGSTPTRRRVLLASLATLLSACAGAQTLIHVSDTATPNGVVSLVGDGLASSRIFVRKAYGGSAFGATQECTALLTSDQVVQARLPGGVDRGPIQIWVTTAAGGSNVLAMNAPRVTFQSRDRCYPGEYVFLYGHNLINGEAAPIVRFLAPDGTYLTARIVSSNYRRLIVSAPDDVVPGVAYRIEVSNAGTDNIVGRGYGTSTVTAFPRHTDVFGLGTALASGFAPFVGNIYNARTDWRLPVKAAGDGVTDDTDAIQYALDLARASGGGIVYLPAGTYKVDKPARGGNYWSALNVWSKTVLKGAGKGVTILRFGARFTPSVAPRDDFFMTLHKGGTNGLSDLTLQNMSTSPLPVNVLRKGDVGVPQSAVILNNVDFQLNNATAPYLADLDHSVIHNCRFASTSLTENPISLVGARWLQLTYSTLSYRVGYVGLTRTSDCWVMNSGFERDMNYAIPGMPWSGGIEGSLSTRLAIENCALTGIGPRTLKGDLDGEMLGAQMSIVRDLHYVGTATGATTTTVTDAAAAWSGSTPLTDPNFPGPPRVIVAITKGKGFGQWRFIDHLSGKSIVVTTPWQIVPDDTSVYTIHGLTAYQQTMLWNTLTNGTTGIQFYDGGIDNLVAENRLVDTGFIAFRAQCSNDADGVSNWRNEINWYNFADGNALVDNASLMPVAISVITVVPEVSGICNSSLGNEIRFNSVTTSRTSTHLDYETCWDDGFFNKGVVYSGASLPIANVGSVFSGNWTQGLSQSWYPWGASLCAGFF